MFSWRWSVLAAEPKRREVLCERRYTPNPQTTILHWQAGLDPLYVRKSGVGDALDGCFELRVKRLEWRM